MCSVIDIACSEDSDERHESGDEDHGLIGTRSWLQLAVIWDPSVLSNGVVSSFCANFLVTNYALDWKGS